MDPIRLDRARKTKTPSPASPPWMMLGVNNLGMIEGRGVGGGGKNSCFILTHDNPLPNLNGPFHRNTKRQWDERLRQLLENIPPDISTRIRMCECFI